MARHDPARSYLRPIEAHGTDAILIASLKFAVRPWAAPFLFFWTVTLVTAVTRLQVRYSGFLCA
jgi:hypothetical protein